MPIYEYQCQGCHHRFEQIQKMSDAPVTLCPNCNQNQVQRLISAAGFQLKGTGWYVTDFKDKGKPKSQSSKDESSAPSSSETASMPSKEASTQSEK